MVQISPYADTRLEKSRENGGRCLTLNVIVRWQFNKCRLDSPNHRLKRPGRVPKVGVTNHE